MQRGHIDMTARDSTLMGPVPHEVPDARGQGDREQLRVQRVTVTAQITGVDAEAHTP